MRRRANTSFVVFLGYAAISFAYFGWRLLPHPGRPLVGHPLESDAEIFIWSFAWWPHAILHWTNPFYTHAVYAPVGINLGSVTSVPGLAIPFSPLTLLFGPAASYNVAAVLLPALSAWTAYLLCRYLTRSTVAAVAGGYIFGFSSYMLAQQYAGHVNLTAVFLVPLVALVLVRYLRNELSGRGLAWRLGLLLALQIYISTEVSVTLTVVLVLGLLLAFALVRDARPRLVSAVVPVAVGYAIALVLAAPLIYYAWTGLVPGVNSNGELFSGDLLNLVVPTRVVGWGGHWLNALTTRFPGDTAERDLYLGPFVLLVIALLAVRRWHQPVVRYLVGAFAVAILLSLGTALHVDGHRIVWLPWSVPNAWRGLEQVIPSRMAAYATLAAAALVAYWIATTSGRMRPYVLPVLAVAALVPPFWTADDVQHPARWAFFGDKLYKVCIPRNETLLIFPFGPFGDSLLWQAESGFWFRMAEGSLTHNDQPAKFATDPVNDNLLFVPATLPSMPELLGLAKRAHVDRVLSVVGTNGDAYPSGTDMHAFGPLQVLGGVYVAPACGYDSLAGDRRPPPTG